MFILLLLHLNISTYFHFSVQSLFSLVFLSLTDLKGDPFFTGCSGRKFFLCYTLPLEKVQSIQNNLKIWSDSSMYPCFWGTKELSGTSIIVHCLLPYEIVIARLIRILKWFKKIAGDNFLKQIKEILHQNVETAPDFQDIGKNLR